MTANIPGAGSTPASGPGPERTGGEIQVPPYLVAAVDQDQALLQGLVQMARDHRDAVCHWPLPCGGALLADQVAELDCGERVRLLMLAVVELAALGYGIPTAATAYEVTDAGAAALDDDGYE